jgi:hypothetical protein
MDLSVAGSRRLPDGRGVGAAFTRRPRALGEPGRGPVRAWAVPRVDGAASAPSTDAKVDAGQYLEGVLPVSINDPDWRIGASRDGMASHQQRPSALALQDGAAIGHEPRVTDLDEAEGQDVSEKALDEAFGVKCHGVGAAGTKRHAACIEALQAAVADPDTMGVLAEIAKDLRGPRERRLGLDVPVNLVQAVHERFEIVGAQVAADTVRATRPGEPRQKLPAK